MRTGLAVSILRAARDPDTPVMPIDIWTQLRDNATDVDYPRLMEIREACFRLRDAGYLEYAVGDGFVTTSGGIARLATLLARLTGPSAGP